MPKTVDALVLDTIDELEWLAKQLPDHQVIDRNRIESSDRNGFRTLKELLYTAARILKAYNSQYYLTQNDLDMIGEAKP